MQMKPMTIDETTRDGVTILTLQGMLMYRPDLSSFYQRIQESTPKSQIYLLMKKY